MPRIRLIGIDTPEIQAETEIERQKAILARDYLKSLILGKYVFISFEASNTTLDGVARGAFGRELGYIFSYDENDNPILINLDMIYREHAKLSDYDFNWESFFELTEKETNEKMSKWTIMKSTIRLLKVLNSGLASPNRIVNKTTTWARLKKVQ